MGDVERWERTGKDDDFKGKLNPFQQNMGK